MSGFENPVIRDFITYFQTIICIGGAVRIAYCFIMLPANEDDERSYKMRIRNALVFIIIVITLLDLIKLILKYFGG